MALLVLSPSAAPGAGHAQASAQLLQLTISPDSSRISEPFPIRLVLHFHNSGTRPLWIYKPVRDAAGISEVPAGANPGGSSLAVHLEPQSSAVRAASRAPAVGTLLRPAGMPHPALVQIAPGADYAETVPISIAPAKAGGSGSAQPIWGTYKISVAYSASFANGTTIDSNLGVDVWQGSVSSNEAGIQFEPAPATAAGTISGTVVSRQMQPDWGILVSLSDSDQHVIEQSVTGYDGAFSFSHLPEGRYWVTVRRPGTDRDTGFFEHADISSSQPETQLKLIMLNPEEYDAKQLLHKPVLVRLTDPAGSPVAGAALDILWSSGTVMEQQRVQTGENGLAQVSLIAGSNYVTIRKRHCPKQDEMVDVASGRGIDGFSLTLNCRK